MFLTMIIFQGIKMSKRCLTAVICRYSNKKGTVDFDDFLQIYTKVVGLIGKK